MIISAILQREIASVRRRERFQRALEACVPAAAYMAFAWMALRLFAALRLLPVPIVQAAAAPMAALVILWAVGRAFAARLPRAQVVRELDRRARAKGRLIAAVELGGDPSPFARAAVEQAGEHLRGISVPALFPLRAPREALGALALIALAPAAAFALAGSTVDWSRWKTPAPATADGRDFELRGDELEAAAKTLDLPTMAWAVREAKTVLEPLRAPAATPTPPALALAPTPVPTRGSTITDPEARQFFDEVLSGATSESVAKEITQRFTGPDAPPAYKAMIDQFKFQQVSTGSKYDVGAKENETGGAQKMPGTMGGSSGGIKPVVDPSKLKAQYKNDMKDQASELQDALKASFDEYLREFSEQMLKGMEEALEKQLSQPGGPAGGSPKTLPGSPAGMASESHDASDGPMIAAKQGGAPSASMQGAANAALGGTAAGGVGAGAGTPGASATDGAAGDAKAAGDRLDLGGTLDQKLAVVEVIKRMSGGAETTDDTAAAEVVRKATKAAEVQAAASDDVPPEYRAAVEAYFRGLSEKK